MAFQTHLRVSTLILCVAILASCGKKEQAGAMQGGMPAMPVSVIAMQPSDVPVTAEAVGQTQGVKEVEVRPRVGGIVLKKLFEEGATIKAGQAMFMIDPSPFKLAVAEAQAQVAQYQARIVQTQREAERLKGLLATQSISQREYDNATSDSAMASASLMQAQAALKQAQLNLSYTTVTAPTDGTAGRFLFSEGALVDANTSLLTTIVQLQPIWVRFSFSDAELAKMGGRLDANHVQALNLLMPDGSEYNETGRLNFAASAIDPAYGTQQLRAEFPNAQRTLLPGQFTRVRVTTGTQKGVYLVPQTAVLTGEQGKFVLVADKNAEGKTVAGVRPVEVGSWQGQNWVILHGLNAGDKVIVDNLIKLRPGAEVVPHAAGDTLNPQPKQ